MGGGDLNSKKSWHPNTMKNQERVWKAEQAAAEEKKRIQELQHERAAERDRAELNDLAKRSAGATNNDDRLHWMYDKPDKKGQSEDYLLGKTIEKNYDKSEKSDDVIPAVARRVVGSSMMTSTEDSQVDLVRKLREDPLLLVKERERAARAALLNNPLHRKRITELLRKEQEQRKGSKAKKTKKKGKDLDSMLAAKLNSLGGDKGVDVAALLASDDSSSSSESSDDDKRTKKKKKKKSDKKTKKVKSSKKTKKDNDAESSDENNISKNEKNIRKQLQHNKHISLHYESTSRKERKRYHSESSDSERNVRKREVEREITSENRRSWDNFRNKPNLKEPSYDGDHQRRSRRQRSKSRDFYMDKRKRDISEDKTYEGYWAQSRKRSPSSGSNEETKNKFIERKRNNYNKKESKRQRSGSHEYRSKKNRDESSRAKDNKTRQRSVCQDSDKESRNKRKKDVSEDRKYKDDERKQRSLSQEKQAKNKANKRENLECKSKYETSSRSHRDSEISNQIRESERKISVNKIGRAEENQGRIKRGGLSAEDIAARLLEMAAAGAEREAERGRRVAAQRAQGSADAAPRLGARPHARALPDSLESRIHSNRHYIQRNQSHMNEHFARR